MEVKDVQERLIAVADEIIANKEYLTDLDRSIGDADHGVNMAKGFNFVKEDLEANEYETYKDLLMKVSSTLLSKVGGASGPLYGTFFMKAAGSLKDVEDLDQETLAKAFKEGVDGVKTRGKAEVGDKTMVDVLEPVADALADGKSYEEVVKLAEEKRDATSDLVAKRGRASYVGERSVGHIDPGAASSYIIIEKIFGGLGD